MAQAIKQTWFVCLSHQILPNQGTFHHALGIIGEFLTSKDAPRLFGSV